MTVAHNADLHIGLKSHLSYKLLLISHISSVQFSSVAQPCPTLCYPMNRSMPVLPVHHQNQSLIACIPSEYIGDAQEAPGNGLSFLIPSLATDRRRCWAWGVSYGSSVQFSCSVLFDFLHPMDCSMPGFPIDHQPLELTQTRVH